MKARRPLGWLLIAGGVPFLLLGMSMTVFGASFLGRVEYAVVALNGVTGASLVTAGVRRLGARTWGQLAAVWGVAFLLVFATVFFNVGFLMIFVLFGHMPPSALGRSLLQWRTAAAVGVVVLLVVLSVRRSPTARPHPPPDVRTVAARTASGLVMTAGFLGLATLGAAAWFVATPLLARTLGLLPASAMGPFGMVTLVTSPIGFVAGILAGLWVNAAEAGRPRLLRYGVAALVLIALPILLFFGPPALGDVLGIR